MFWWSETTPTSGTGSERTDWRPELDVFERRDGLLLCFSLPGVDEDDVEVLSLDDVLIVRGTRKLDPPTDARARRIELPRGRFERRVRLTAPIASEDVQTQLTRGLLLVHVPRARGHVRIKVRPRPG
jgi:HSP20 family molecular chaperone IbpA